MHTCFYTAYLLASMQGTGVVQVGADAAGGAEAYTSGVARTHGHAKEMRLVVGDTSWYGPLPLLHEAGVR